ncbi:uncharacterized protein LTR77_004422 [Saxophila tyrrhenica]|uniref:Integral membrane protein n=1 Tax=Saxophila tyrrhenica TaxID=1690608 RepID=A0AAV9PGM8_9PEZI|nr:hypothetical protein LTR77_004422 [Saxophila tyrrhenica]
MFGRNKSKSSDDTLVNDEFHPSKQQIKRATRTRFIWALLTSFLLLVSIVFIILVEVGSTSLGSIRTDIYFIRLDLADIIPVRVPNAVLINSIAQSLGLHDFYTVGLWGFCEGYNGQGFNFCSKPETLYWFNPVNILQNELLAGATIALPAQIDDVLNLIHTVSNWMFALFLTGACLSFFTMFIVPVSVFSRWATLATMLLTFFSALFTTVATVLATVMFIIMRNAITSVTQLNIGASIGVEMFVFMWIAAGAAILAWIIQLGQCCCCASRRDVRTGRKRGSKKAYRGESNAESNGESSGEMSEKQPGRFSRLRGRKE